MRTGPFGTLQSIADALKLLTKEDLRPATADLWLFELAPYVTFVPVFMILLALPFMEGWGVRDLQLGLFYIVAVSGVTVIGYIMAGWASDNKYALLGAVRSAAQLISYEIPLILAVLAVVDGRRHPEPQRHHLPAGHDPEHPPAAAALLHPPHRHCWPSCPAAPSTSRSVSRSWSAAPGSSTAASAGRSSSP